MSKLGEVIALATALALLAACSQNAPSASRHSTALSPASGVRPSASTSSQSTPQIPPHAAAYPTALDAGIGGIEAKTGLTYSGGNCGSTQSCLSNAQVFGNPDTTIGLDAAYVQVGYAGSGTGNCFAYVFFDSAGWHYTMPVVCPRRAGYNPALGAQDHVALSGSCANVRQGPSLSAKIVTCLKDGTIVQIDTIFPRYVDAHIWWSIDNQQGWMAHDFLITDTSA